MTESILHESNHDPLLWQGWQPVDRANLCFILHDGRILLIRKKRGLGAGKLNGPGGKLEPGETVLQSAIRETREEIGVTPLDPELHGELHFDFTDGYRLHCSVFRADAYEGEPVSTVEADPVWHDPKQLPFEEMWSDDRFWLPLLVEGRCFRGFFQFDHDTMLALRVEEVAHQHFTLSNS